MKKLTFIVTLAAILSACSTPLNNQIDAVSLALESVSEQIDTLERSGYIGADEEREIQIKLAKAHLMLVDYSLPLGDLVSICNGAETRIECAELVLSEASSILAEAGK